MWTKMNAPPPYYAPAPRKSNVGLIVAIVVGVLAVCCVVPGVVLGFLGKSVFDHAMGFVGCGWSIGQMRDGMVAYAKAHGGKLPAKDHWQDDISSYLKPLPPNSKGITLPPQNGDVCDLQAGSSVTYNEDLAGTKLNSIDDPSNTIILWETAGKGRNQHSKYSPPSVQSGPKLVGNIPRGWIQQPLSGNAYYSDQNGMQQPIPSPGSTRGGVRIETKAGD
jgi:hypothetical protein